MQDRPNARELVEAVASFLETEILPTLTDPRLRYRSLVATNVLQVVARELARGDAGWSAALVRLAVVLGNSPADVLGRDADLASSLEAMKRAFCTRIRPGDFDAGDRLDLALDCAEANVVDKLTISNPRFLARIGVGRSNDD